MARSRQNKWTYTFLIVSGLVTTTLGLTKQGELKFISSSSEGRSDSFSSDTIRINGEVYTKTEARELGFKEVRPGVWSSPISQFSESSINRRGAEQIVIINGNEYTPEEAKTLGYEQVPGRSNVWRQAKVTRTEVRRIKPEFKSITINGESYNTKAELIAAGFREVSSSNGHITWVKPPTVNINGKSYTQASLLEEGYIQINGQWRKQEAWENDGYSRNGEGVWIKSKNTRADAEYRTRMEADGYYELFGEWKTEEDWNKRGYWNKQNNWQVVFSDGYNTTVQEQENIYSLKMKDPCNTKVTRNMMESAGFIEAYGQWRLEDDWESLGWDSSTNTIDPDTIEENSFNDLWSIIPEPKSIEIHLTSGQSQYVKGVDGNKEGTYYSVEELYEYDYDYLCGEWRPMTEWNARGYFKGSNSNDFHSAKSLWWVLSKEGIWKLVRQQGWSDCDVEITPGEGRRSRSELESQGYHELFGEWKTIPQWRETGWRKSNVGEDSEYFGLWEHIDGPNANYPGCLMSYYYIMFGGNPNRPDQNSKINHEGKTIGVVQLYELGYGWLWGIKEKLEFFADKGYEYSNGIWWHSINDRWEIVWSKPQTFDDEYYTLFGESRTIEYWKASGYQLIDGRWYIVDSKGFQTEVDVTKTTVTVYGKEWSREELISAGYYEIWGKWKTMEEWKQEGIIIYGWGYWEWAEGFGHGVIGAKAAEGPEKDISPVDFIDGDQCQHCYGLGEKGVPGQSGPNGGVGEPGIPGHDGANGVRGMPGKRGPRGEAGNPGADGAQGLSIHGADGVDGEPGQPGPDGERGAPGFPGADATDADPGQQGDDGVPGVNGNPGPPGDPGLPGLPGADLRVAQDVEYEGSTCPECPKGLPGPRGLPGFKGHVGYPGEAGETGKQGEFGPAGEAGPEGPEGRTGAAGVSGESGKDGANGPKGPKGPPGTNGETGQPGVSGESGRPGENGKQGPPGQQGAPGKAGADGETGLPGETGSPGSNGIDGIPGLDGNEGLPGPAGAEGAPGEQGKKGPAGKDGEAGEQGAPGKDGPDGEPGSAGNPGEQGEMGAPGQVGSKGVTGARGLPGDSGEQGAAGEPGIPGGPGPNGGPGESGKQGEDGAKGKTGAPGFPGDKGETGVPGESGKNGETGKAGIKGKRGTPGLRGAKGNPGEDGPRGREGPAGPMGNSGGWGPPGANGPKGPRGRPGQVGMAGEDAPVPSSSQIIEICTELFEAQLQQFKKRLRVKRKRNNRPQRGPPGPPGVRGVRGPTGKDGEKGDTGRPGRMGVTGDIGPKGLQGHAGAQGDRGPRGLDQRGKQGERGPQGLAGAPGLSLPGKTGENGAAGLKGPIGLRGAQGDMGQPGACINDNCFTPPKMEALKSGLKAALPDE